MAFDNTTYQREYARRRRADPQQRAKEREAGRVYREANAEKCRQRTRDWRAKNKEARAAYQREYMRNLRATDPVRKLRRDFSSYVSISLSRRGLYKAGKLADILGYTAEELARHIERQFVHGMSWDNRSEWHIDHIIPLASFCFASTDDPEFKRAWSLPNLRPVWKHENLKKRCTRTHLL